MASDPLQFKHEKWQAVVLVVQVPDVVFAVVPVGQVVTHDFKLYFKMININN